MNFHGEFYSGVAKQVNKLMEKKAFCKALTPLVSVESILVVPFENIGHN